MFCPACSRQLMQKNTMSDWLLCMEHGQMSPMLVLDLKGLPPWSALIDIRAEQAKRELRRMTYVRIQAIQTQGSS